MILATTKKFGSNETVPFGALCWRSHKLRRVIGSTLAGETMAALEAQGILEWVKTLYAELTTHSLDLRKREDAMAKRESYHVVDANSLFDHVRSSSPSSGVEDRRAGIDLVILKECLARTNSVMRWAPTTAPNASGRSWSSMTPVPHAGVRN